MPEPAPSSVKSKKKPLVIDSTDMVTTAGLIFSTNGPSDRREFEDEGVETATTVEVRCKDSPLCGSGDKTGSVAESTEEQPTNTIPIIIRIKFTNISRFLFL